MPVTKPKKKNGTSTNTKKGGSPSGTQGISPATPSKKDVPPVAHEWRNVGSEVCVTLVTGPLGPAAASRLQFNCSERRVQLRLPDGRGWASRLFATVLPDGSGYQLRPGGRLLIRLLKHDPSLTWTSLEPIKIPRVKALPATKEMKDKSNAEKSEESAVRTPAEQAGPPPVNGVAPATDGESPPPAPSRPSAVEPAQTPRPASAVEPVVLDNLKYNTHETDAEICVSIYVKQIKNETLTVSYESDSFTIVFGTSDQRFLAERGHLDECFLFCWTVPLKGRVRAELCDHKVTGSAVELRLVKASPGRWNALRPPAATAAAAAAAASASASAAAAATAATATTASPTPGAAAESSGGGRPVCSSPSQASESAAVPDPAAGGDQPDVRPKVARPPSPLPLALPAPPPAAPLERGLTGLDNIGNTCFLNTVIQCLANTRELRDYFSDSVFQSDINRQNPLGMNGQLALSFAVLLRVLWNGQYRAYNPYQLKLLVAKKATQFTGFAQHDAQEFMAFLLDGLHEDLNRVRVKPYTQTEDTCDRPHDEMAREAWYRYRLRDDSIIVDLFQGQYKSKLVCPGCGKVSVTFDPFLYLSVPLPKKKRPVSVTFFRVDPTVRPVTYNLYVTADGLADEIMENLAEKTGVSSKLIKLIDERKHKVLKVYPRGMSIGTIGRSSHLLAFEQLDPIDFGEPVVELLVIQRLLCPSAARICSSCRKEPTPDEKLRRCTRCYRTSYCDLACQREHWSRHKELCRPWPPEPVGCPFLVSLPRSRATYTAVCRAMEAFSRYSVNVFCVPVTADRERRDSISSGTSSDSGKCTDTDEPAAEKEASSGDSADYKETPPSPGVGDQQLFFIKPVDQQGQSITTADGARLQDCGDEPLELRGACTLAMDWKTNRRSQPCCLVDDKELESDRDPRPGAEPSGDICLDQCLQLFTEPEKLSPGEAWYCPRCKTHREAEKQMSLWRLPLNLIIQLKRFSFKDCMYRDKIDKMVEFPARGLNLRQYLTQDPEEGRALYDLYGVINHHGGILGGHYTAFARCVDPLRPQLSEHDWRLFDDARVTRVSEDRVVTSEAYLLFYRRRIPYAAPERATDAEEID